MKHIKTDFPILTNTLGIRNAKHGFLGRTVNRDQVALVIDINSVMVDIRLQRRDIFRHTKQHGTSIVELDRKIIQHTIAAPVIR